MFHRALLIIDMQMGLFYGPETPHDGECVLSNINTLIDRAHQAQAPVFAARHTGPEGSAIAPGSPLTQLLPALHLDNARDRVFDKTRPSCFVGTPLAQWLREANIDELVVVGMKTEFCVDTTCRAAAELGFNPLLVDDAHTTMDTPVLSAQAIIAHHNRTLSGPFVKRVSTADFLF